MRENRRDANCEVSLVWADEMSRVGPGSKTLVASEPAARVSIERQRGLRPMDTGRGTGKRGRLNCPILPPVKYRAGQISHSCVFSGDMLRKNIWNGASSIQHETAVPWRHRRSVSQIDDLQEFVLGGLSQMILARCSAKHLAVA